MARFRGPRPFAEANDLRGRESMPPAWNHGTGRLNPPKSCNERGGQWIGRCLTRKEVWRGCAVLFSAVSTRWLELYDPSSRHLIRFLNRRARIGSTRTRSASEELSPRGSSLALRVRIGRIVQGRIDEVLHDVTSMVAPSPGAKRWVFSTETWPHQRFQAALRTPGG